MKGMLAGGSHMMEKMQVTEQATSRCYRRGHTIFIHYYCSSLKWTLQSLVSILRKGCLVFNVCSSGYKRSQEEYGKALTVFYKFRNVCMVLAWSVANLSSIGMDDTGVLKLMF